jgi:hypothetical protein
MNVGDFFKTLMAGVAEKAAIDTYGPDWRLKNAENERQNAVTQAKLAEVDRDYRGRISAARMDPHTAGMEDDAAVAHLAGEGLTDDRRLKDMMASVNEMQRRAAVENLQSQILERNKPRWKTTNTSEGVQAFDERGDPEQLVRLGSVPQRGGGKPSRTHSPSEVDAAMDYYRKNGALTNLPPDLKSAVFERMGQTGEAATDPMKVRQVGADSVAAEVAIPDLRNAVQDFVYAKSITDKYIAYNNMVAAGGVAATAFGRGFEQRLTDQDREVYRRALQPFQGANTMMLWRPEVARAAFANLDRVAARVGQSAARKQDVLRGGPAQAAPAAGGTSPTRPPGVPPEAVFQNGIWVVP